MDASALFKQRLDATAAETEVVLDQLLQPELAAAAEPAPAASHGVARTVLVKNSLLRSRKMLRLERR